VGFVEAGSFSRNFPFFDRKVRNFSEFPWTFAEVTS